MLTAATVSELDRFARSRAGDTYGVDRFVALLRLAFGVRGLCETVSRAADDEDREEPESDVGGN